MMERIHDGKEVHWNRAMRRRTKPRRSGRWLPLCDVVVDVVVVVVVVAAVEVGGDDEVLERVLERDLERRRCLRSLRRRMLRWRWFWRSLCWMRLMAFLSWLCVMGGGGACI